ncbi:AAA family ATPase [Actinomadura madurae]|uniref:helix-turn-helix transcriptional regulator n=1 Tax=Actinomadura madurae TaxID=1993 RepID=UPI0020261A0D|nr:LuxR family transcriptional regulator [Actinomadura madurae]URN06937.1 AAA family ATPase [Actinomadura madurae]
MRGPPGAGGGAPVSAPAFVGRDREFAALRDALGAPPALALVEGEAGIGKSRLLGEFLSAPGLTGGRVLLAVCPPFRVPLTLGPIVDAVRESGVDSVAGLRLSGLAGALRSLFPEWLDELPEPLEPAEDALAARHRLFRALAELLDRLGVALLVVDDAHWADEATLDFLMFLVSRRPQPMSLVVAYRPEDVPDGSAIAHLSARPRGEVTRLRLTLGPLDLRDTARLVSSMLAGGRVSEAFARFLHRHTEGLPLAIEESVLLMNDRTDLRWRGGEWVRRRLDDIHVPPTVRDAVLERAQRLRPDTQAVLRAAAVLMDAAAGDALAAITGLEPGRVRDGVSQGLACGLLTERSGGTVGFRHSLAGRAVYDAIPQPDRQALHRRAGTFLESAPRPPLMRLARHFRDAGDVRRWRGYAERAADEAASDGDHAAAAAVLHDLIVSADLPPHDVAPLVAKIALGSLWGTTPTDEVVRALRTAIGSGALDTAQTAFAHFQLGLLLAFTDDFDGGRPELERAIPGLPPHSPDLLDAMTTLGWPRGSTCPGQVHRDWLHRAAAAARPLPAADHPVITIKRATALLLLDEPAGWEVAATLPAEARTPAQRRALTVRGANLGHMAVRWGRYSQARRELDRGLELADRHGYPRYRASVLATSMYLDWLTGAWTGLADRVADLADEDVQPLTRLEVRFVAGLLAAAEGRDADAEATFRHVVAETHARAAVEWLADPAAALARMCLSSGRVADALDVTEVPMRIVQVKETWLWATELAPVRVGALVAAGRDGEAADLVAAFGRGLRGRDAPAARAALTLCRGIRCEAGGEPRRAAALFARAAAAWDGLPRPYDALLARERQAHRLLAAGAADEALSLLTGVADGLTALGARGDAARVTRDLRLRGVAVRQPWRGGRRGYGDRLSPRELDVAHLVAQGLTNREIGEALFLSPKTVARHINSATRKLGVSTRTALAMKVAEAETGGAEGRAATSPG